MDPKSALNRLLDAVFDNEPDEAEAALRDLLDWMGKGGFAPDLGEALDRLRDQRELTAEPGGR